MASCSVMPRNIQPTTNSLKSPVCWVYEYCYRRKWLIKFEAINRITTARDCRDFEVHLFIEDPGVREFRTISSTKRTRNEAKYNAAFLMQTELRTGQRDINSGNNSGIVKGWPETPIVTPIGQFITMTLPLPPPPPPRIMQGKTYEEEDYVDILHQYCAQNGFASPGYEQRGRSWNVYMRCTVKRPGLKVPFEIEWLKYRTTGEQTEKFVAFAMLRQISNNMDKFTSYEKEKLAKSRINTAKPKPQTNVVGPTPRINVVRSKSEVNAVGLEPVINVVGLKSEVNVVGSKSQVNVVGPKTQLPQVNAVEPKPERPQVNVVGPKRQIPQVNAVEPKPELPQVNAVEPKRQLPQENAAELKPELPQVNAAEPKPELPQGNAVEPKPELPQVNAVGPKPQLPQVNSVRPKQQLPQVNFVRSKPQLPQVNDVRPKPLINAVETNPKINSVGPKQLKSVDKPNPQVNAVGPKQLKSVDKLKPQVNTFVSNGLITGTQLKPEIIVDKSVPESEDEGDKSPPDWENEVEKDEKRTHLSPSSFMFLLGFILIVIYILRCVRLSYA